MNLSHRCSHGKTKCYVCGKEVGITKKGRLCQHHNLPSRVVCFGSGYRVKLDLCTQRPVNEES